MSFISAEMQLAFSTALSDWAVSDLSLVINFVNFPTKEFLIPNEMIHFFLYTSHSKLLLFFDEV